MTDDGFQFWLFPGEEPHGTVPLLEKLSVFARRKTASDVLDLREDLHVTNFLTEFLGQDHGLRREQHPGALVTERSRLLLSDVGRKRGKIFGVPTRHGWVCLIGTNRIAAVQCIRGLLPEGIAPAASRRNRHVAIYGLAANDVSRIEIELERRSHRAILANNAFFFEFSEKETSLDSVRGIRIYRADGRQTDFSLELAGIADL